MSASEIILVSSPGPMDLVRSLNPLGHAYPGEGMSRSKRYPMCTVSKKVDEKAHRAVRKHVKQTLQTMDPNDPPILDIEGDTRTLGHEEWGTKFGWDPSEILDEEDTEDRKRMMRK